MKIVAVSQRVDLHPERRERRDALDQRVGWWLAQAGYCPLPVPNTLAGGPGGADLPAWLAATGAAAVVLSGGNDLGQAPERDATERGLLAYASAHRLPLLGICRGMQMMGGWAGARLKPVVGHVRTRHALSGRIAGPANSFHVLALAACPPGYLTLATSEDGEIEAMRHRELPWEGWMWHPEREAVFSERDNRRLRALIDD